MLLSDHISVCQDADSEKTSVKAVNAAWAQCKSRHHKQSYQFTADTFSLSLCPSGVIIPIVIFTDHCSVLSKTTA